MSFSRATSGCALMIRDAARASVAIVRNSSASVMSRIEWCMQAERARSVPDGGCSRRACPRSRRWHHARGALGPAALELSGLDASAERWRRVDLDERVLDDAQGEQA